MPRLISMVSQKIGFIFCFQKSFSTIHFQVFLAQIAQELVFEMMQQELSQARFEIKNNYILIRSKRCIILM
jgi:hypothetical protein